MRKSEIFLKDFWFFWFFVFFYYYYQWGWTRPSHSGWAETGPARFSRVGATSSPTVSLSLSFNGFGLDLVEPSRMGRDGSSPLYKWIILQKCEQYAIKKLQIAEESEGEKKKKRVTWHRGFNCEEEIRLVTMEALVEGLVAGVTVVLCWWSCCYYGRCWSYFSGWEESRRSCYCWEGWKLLDEVVVATVIVVSRWQKRKKK